MRCRLCLQERELRRSHILPELLWQPLYGPTHQVRSVNPDLSYVRFPKKGLREHLLCGECEARLGVYENAFARFWNGTEGLPERVPEAVGFVHKAARDYQAFKLFHLSILWRASVSTLVDFAGVSLGPHQERLRLMILAGDAGPPMAYRLAASIVLRPGSREVHRGVIGVPQRGRINGHSIYSALYAGCMWHCLLSTSMTISQDVLNEDGGLTMPVLDIRNLPALLLALLRGANARRDRKVGGGRPTE